MRTPNCDRPTDVALRLPGEWRSRSARVVASLGVTRADSPGLAPSAPCKRAPRAERAPQGADSTERALHMCASRYSAFTFSSQ